MLRCFNDEVAELLEKTTRERASCRVIHFARFCAKTPVPPKSPVIRNCWSYILHCNPLVRGWRRF
jgi:hypothetical protein